MPYYLGKHGDLTVGYGAPKEGFGPEFNFGHVIGNHFDEQVLIIKTSWGGRALARGFLPPSSMLTDEEYAALAVAQNTENEAWNKAEPAKIDAYNKRVTEQNKTAEKKNAIPLIIHSNLSLFFVLICFVMIENPSCESMSSTIVIAPKRKNNISAMSTRWCCISCVKSW